MAKLFKMDTKIGNLPADQMYGYNNFQKSYNVYDQLKGHANTVNYNGSGGINLGVTLDFHGSHSTGLGSNYNGNGNGYNSYASVSSMRGSQVGSVQGLGTDGSMIQTSSNSSICSHMNSPLLSTSVLNQPLNQQLGLPMSKDKSKDQDIEKYKLQLNFKSQMINNLKKKLDARNESTEVKTTDRFYKVFKDLATKLDSKEQKLAETTAILESLLVSSQINQVGNIDEYELGNKIVNKLKYLTEENETLLTMISHSSKLSLLIEVGLLKNEIKVLKTELSKYTT